MKMFAVIEKTLNDKTGEYKSRTVMKSDSKLMCYEQALVLQRLTFNDPDDTQTIYYFVEEN